MKVDPGTGSFSPVIYKVDANGKASVFIQSDFFKCHSVALNGIAWSKRVSARGQ
jgi:hypothetical protein